MPPSSISVSTLSGLGSFVACEDCAAHLALSLLLDNRVYSFSGLSEARRIFIRYLSIVHCIRMLQFYARVVVEWYVQRPFVISERERANLVVQLAAIGIGYMQVLWDSRYYETLI